jgi:hypothetical protein
VGRTYGVDLNMILKILRFNSQQQRPEPLERPEISADPEEVDLAQTRPALRVVHAVPDALENGSEWGNTDTGTDQDGDFELEHVLGGGSERSVDIDSGENLA